MQEYNYFVNCLKNRSKNFFIELQTNWFTIVDQSNGQVLDSTVDCDFLSFLSLQTGSLNVSGNNQINLTVDQATQYMAVRMYYYNPKILDSIISELYTSYVWYDISDTRCLAMFDLNTCPNIILNKGQAGNRNSSCALDSTSYYYRYLPQLFNSYIFFHLYPPLAGARYNINASAIPFQFGLTTAFTLAGVFYCDYDLNYTTFYWIGDIPSGRYAELQFSRTATVCMFRLILYYDGVVNQTIDFTFPTPADGLYRFCLSGDMINCYGVLNEESFQSEVLTTMTNTTLNSKYLLNNYAKSNDFLGKFLECILSPQYTSPANMEKVVMYFKTKYFVEA